MIKEFFLIGNLSRIIRTNLPQSLKQKLFLKEEESDVSEHIIIIQHFLIFLTENFGSDTIVKI